MAHKLLTKSNYLTGLICLKSLWLEKHKKEILPTPNNFFKKFNGTRFGSWQSCKKLF